MTEAFDWGQAVFVSSLMQGPHPSLGKRHLHPRLFAHTERDALCRVDINFFGNRLARNGS